MAELTRADLMAVLDARKAAGTLRTANVLFTDLRQMLAFAQDRELIATAPLAGLKRAKIGGKDTERERVLRDDELRLLLQATSAATGGMGVSWWLARVAAGEAPKPAIQRPRMTRWRLVDVREFWAAKAAANNAQAAPEAAQKARSTPDRG